MHFINRQHFVLFLILFLTIVSGCESIPAKVFESQVAYDRGVVEFFKDKDGCRIHILGDISEKLIDAFNLHNGIMSNWNCSSVTVTLNSDGGKVMPAIFLGEIIRERGYSTEIKSGNSCNSACGLIFIGGGQRVVRGGNIFNLYTNDLGFHQPRNSNKNTCITLSDVNNPTAMKIYAYAKKMLTQNALKKFLALFYRTDCSKIDYVSADDLMAAGIATKLKTILGD